MGKVLDSQNKAWGIRLNKKSWPRVEDWPDWTRPMQREKWPKEGVIIWDEETHTVTRLKGRGALSILSQLRDNPEFLQQECTVGEPAWQISLDEPGGKGKPVLTNKIRLAPEQTGILLELLEQEEETLIRLAEKEEAEINRTYAQLFDFLLEIAERGEHTIYDENLSWEENKQIMRQRWESGEFPKELTRIEERLFHDVLTEINAEHQRKDLIRERRAQTIRKNLATHHFFWERLKKQWSYFRPAERLHVLQLLQEKEWDERTLAEVRQIIENAQFFTGLSEKTGVVEEPEKVTDEELNLILDLPDEAIWDELIDLYRQ